MKICSQCQTPNTDDSLFCKACGTPLPAASAPDPSPSSSVSSYGYPQSSPSSYQPQSAQYPQPTVFPSSKWQSSYAGPSVKKKKSRRNAWIIGSVSVIVSICVIAAGVFFLYPHLSSSSSDQSGERNRTSLQITPDGESFKKQEARLRKILEDDPTSLEASVDLYAFYIENGEIESAETVQIQQSEVLGSEEQKAFAQSVKAINQDSQLITTPSGKHPYRILASLGDLDLVPIALEGEAWLIHDESGFAFLYPDGTKSAASGKSMASVVSYPNGDYFGAIRACIDDRDPMYAAANAQFPAYNGEQGEYSYCYRTSGLVFPYSYSLLENGSVQLNSTEEEANPDRIPILLKKNGDIDGHYYIYEPASGSLNGPYSKDRPGCFNQLALQSDFNLTVDIIPNLRVHNTAAGSPYWIKNNGTISLISKDGTSRENNFEDALIVDMNAIGGFRDEELHLFDANLNEQYAGYFEAGAAPVFGSAPVKVNDKWQLIQIDPQDSQENTDLAEPKIPETAFGDFPMTTGHGALEESFTISPDGSFQMTDLRYSAYSTPEKPMLTGIHISGQLEPVIKPDGQLVLKIVSLSHDYPLNQERMDASGMPVTEKDPGEIFLGRCLLFYPAGTPWSEVDKTTYAQFYRTRQEDMGPVTTEDILHIHNSGRTYFRKR